MGKVIQYDRGCRGCVHLLQVGKGDYLCDSRVNMDESAVYPIQDNKHTGDWNLCDGEDYEMDILKLHKRARAARSS